MMTTINSSISVITSDGMRCKECKTTAIQFVGDTFGFMYCPKCNEVIHDSYPLSRNEVVKNKRGIGEPYKVELEVSELECVKCGQLRTHLHHVKHCIDGYWCYICGNLYGKEGN